jgi:pimeloyl-ACP methyl ester carboxylesterase
MKKQLEVKESAHAPAGDEARKQLLARIPVTEKCRQLAGVSTAALEGGEGPPLVLLHGPGANATHWMRVIPALVTSHHVIAPDLPGHGASVVEGGGPLDRERILAWLAELIDSTCASPPALVGQILGGAIAARFAAERGDRISRLVLGDMLGLTEFRPAPEFGIALGRYMEQPSEQSHTDLWRRCAFDLDRLRGEMGDAWTPFEAYNLDRARTPSAQTAGGALMARFGLPAIPHSELARIAVPTALIWGRNNLATPLAVAEAAGVRHGWPLTVIDGCGDDSPVERPEAFVTALRASLEPSAGREATR